MATFSPTPTVAAAPSGFAPLHAISTELHVASTQIGAVISKLETGASVAGHDVVAALKTVQTTLATAAAGLFASAPVQQLIKDVEADVEKAFAAILPAELPILENSLAAELPASFNPVLQAILVAVIPALTVNLLKRIPAPTPPAPPSPPAQ